MWETGDLTYPRYVAGHPRNRATGKLVSQVLCGEVEEDVSDADLFVKSDRPIGALMLSGQRFLLCDPIRAAFEPLVAGQVTFVPLRVNGERFWGLRVFNVIDALDRELSKIRYFRRDPDEIDAIEVPVWRGEVIPDPSIFRIPEHGTYTWVTPAVVEAYERSGCDGLSFGVRGRVV